MEWGLEHWASGIPTVEAPQIQAASRASFTTAPTPFCSEKRAKSGGLRACENAGSPPVEAGRYWRCFRRFDSWNSEVTGAFVTSTTIHAVVKEDLRGI